ncbi:MAG TPA: FAD-binding protein [Blastocatellia bacterium]|nr:FAD-binding protein [Blastocatellia bacterium]
MITGSSHSSERRPLKIVVCVKQTPDVAEMKFDNEKKVLVREGVKNILNHFDRRAIAEAIRIRSLIGGEVVAMTMGPPQARDALLECLAVGADRAVHLVDLAFAGADTLATARALAEAIRRVGFDLIMCGKHSVDAETGQVGPEVAELLGIPHVTGVCKLELDAGHAHLTAERETDEGFETVRCSLPALITAAERLIKPVKIKESDLEAVKEREIEIITARDLSPDASLFGIAGSPTWVCDITSLEKSREVEFISGDPDQMAETLVERLSERGFFDGRGKAEERAFILPRREAPPLDGKAVVAVAELACGELRGVSFELLGKGGQLARALGGEIISLLIGRDVSAYAHELMARGADRVCLIEGEQFTDFNPLNYANALVEAIKVLRPYVVLIPSTANGRDYAPRAAARLGLGLTADCVGLDLNDSQELIQLKPAFGGQIVASILSRTRPQMATVRPGIFDKPAADLTRVCPVERIDVNEPADARYRVVASAKEAGRASTALDDAEVVISVGMGIGGPETLPALEPLARALGAAIGATRRVVDKGWVARQQQIGITGRAISPRLYIGVGVRGAFNHTIGIQRSGIIVAINTDPQAEIFQTADYGLVVDFKEILPALTSAIERRTAGPIGVPSD